MRLPAIANPKAVVAVATVLVTADLAGAPAAWKRCARCHPEAVEQYRMSGMGRSISTAANAHPAGVYRHGLSGTTFRTTVLSEGLVQEIERDGLNARYPIDYVIGSGNAAFGYLVRVDDALFQSPISYYTERNRWGMAPGMELQTDPDFSRPVTPECLWCHTDSPSHVPNTVNTYVYSPLDLQSISCGRCHGSAERHLAEPTPGTIFNPAAAPPRERNSVCEQCHLGGLIRILHPGVTFGSYRPGQRIEDFWTVFVGVPPAADRRDRFQVVSHAEQLALSRCAEESQDQLWCGTCHNPHEKPIQPTAYFSRRCQQCHDGSQIPDHSGRETDCISCHMPRRQSHDSGHSAFTDHRIRRNGLPAATPDPPDQLRPWTTDPVHLRQRNMGIANVLYGQQRSSPDMVKNGLEQLLAVAGSLQSDPAGLDALGTAMVLNGFPRSGLRRLQQAVAAGPVSALRYNALAVAWWAVGDTSQAESALQEAIRREPTLESSYRMLSRVYRDLDQPSKLRATWLRLLEKRPKLIQARQAVRLVGVR